MNTRLLALTLAVVPLLSAAPEQSARPDMLICKQTYRAPIVTYRATVNWGPGRTTGRILVGALDTSGVVWIQATNGRFTGQGEESVTFNVSDVSLYPLEFGAYRLSDAAWAEYRSACGQGQCFVSPEGEGVELLTSPVMPSVLTARNAQTCTD